MDFLLMSMLKTISGLKLFLLIIYCQNSICIDYLSIFEENDFAPCVVNSNTLICNASNMAISFRNKTIKFPKPTRFTITEIELIDFFSEEIPENCFRSVAENLISIKIRSLSTIRIINPLAFTDCKNVAILEIKGKQSLENGTIDLNDVFSPLLALQELKLFNLNIANLTGNCFTSLVNLKSLTIDSSFFQSLSPDVFSYNRNLTSLTFIGMKDPVDLIDVLENWPESSKLPSLKTLTIRRCNLKKFPKFSANMVGNLLQLSLAENPINQISLNDTIALSNLEVLSLIATQLDCSSISGLSRLTNLKDLKLADMKTLIDLPAEIETMKSLESIYLDMSKFQKLSIALPESIRRVSISNLQKGTEITSKFLSNSKRITLLHMIGLPMNSIEFLLDNINVINSSLQVLSFDYTDLTQTQLMKFLGSLKNLETLYLNKANMHFITDEVLFNLSNLKQLMLSNNVLQYSSINTYGFQSIAQHLTSLDLGRNPLEFLPPCMFYSFKDFNGLNLLGSSLVCDCHMLWFHDAIKKNNITNPNLNFTCSSDINYGKSFYDLSRKDFKNCSAKIVENCRPIKNGFYPISFSVTYNWDSSILSVRDINGRDLEYLFDFFIVHVKQLNNSLHTDFDTYNFTRTTIDINFPSKSLDTEVCLIMSRNKDVYMYPYNCKTVDMIKLVAEAKLPIFIGVFIGVGLVVLTVVLLIIFMCRKFKKVKKKDSVSTVVSSTEYEDPDEPIQDPEHYADISDHEYGFQDATKENAYESVNNNTYAGVQLSNGATEELIPMRSMDNITTLSRPFNQSKHKFRKRPFISKMLSKARSSSNLVERQRNSVPAVNNSLSMRSLDKDISATMPRQYLSRELPTTPEPKSQRPMSIEFVPPKPRLSMSNIQHLLNNTDEHLNKFSKL